MGKIKIPTPEERRIMELERENKQLNQKINTQDEIIGELLFEIIPQITEGGQQ
ncbi:hypothetical protein [Sporosarcina contaminans]